MNTYIIAEIGQNHNGDMKLAKKLIDIAAMPVYDFFSGETLSGIQAVKFTKRDLSEEMTGEAGNQEYNSPHSFGNTYIEHRRALELSTEQHTELEQYARSKGLGFIETLCSPACVQLLDTVKVDAVKIASRDVTNIPLLEAVAERGTKVIVSSGMCTLEELHQAVSILSKGGNEIWILHCVSEYPAQYHNINLNRIPFLKKEFPDCRIGYSDHTIGIVVPSAAVVMGASVIEKHITLSRSMKGSDHAGALEPEGLWRVARDIRNIEKAAGTADWEISSAVIPLRKKLGRSLALQIPVQKGETLTEQHLCMRSPGTGLSWNEREKVLGRKALIDIPSDSLIIPKNFE